MVLGKELHIQPSEIDNMPFYWIEMLIDLYTDSVEKEEARYKEQERQQRDQYNTNQPNYKMPNVKMPNMGNIKF